MVGNKTTDFSILQTIYMGCLRLTYYDQEEALEVNLIFFGNALEKKGYSDFFA